MFCTSLNCHPQEIFTKEVPINQAGYTNYAGNHDDKKHIPLNCRCPLCSVRISPWPSVPSFVLPSAARHLWAGRRVASPSPVHSCRGHDPPQSTGSPSVSEWRICSPCIAGRPASQSTWYSNTVPSNYIFIFYLICFISTGYVSAVCTAEHILLLTGTDTQ